MKTTTESIFTLHESGAFCAIPVNCVGVAGAGLANAWKQKDPEACKRYKQLCDEGALKEGDFVNIANRWILAATKNHWKDKSSERWVGYILFSARDMAINLPNKTIAIPALGCGCGGLSKKWFVEKATVILDDVPNVVLCIPEECL